MKFDQFGLIITDRCNAACKFCGWRCCPENRGVIDIELAKSALDQAAALGISRRLGITGGEAFLYPELVREILVYARKTGFKICTIATNGFWGSWPSDRIDAVLSAMEGCLDMICFSHDAFHAEYIPERSLWNASKKAAEHGIRFTISVADARGERGAGAFLAGMSEDALKHNYNFYPLQRIGNAMDLPEDIFCTDTPRDDAFCEGAGLFSVLYDGRVFPCCNPGIFDTGFSLGNLHETSLKDCLENSDGIRCLRLLHNKKYFRKVIRKAEEKGLIHVPDMVVSGCELCHQIFRDPDILEQLKPEMREMYQEMVLDRFFHPEKED